ncbi:MAG: NADPH-dependent 7-cyano-7-deazaguanine reductase QueF [Desulfovibrionaceae bacterium]|nr:NADPH-dependent 7-cyano-7-deazaguanine reductase QueF [Desulfovibrionaceae bacterium]
MSRSQDQTDSLTLLKGNHLVEPSCGPSVKLLEVFPNCYRHIPYIIRIDFPEFTSLCPVTGQPDFGRICVDYIADEYCVESKSFKLYMFAFRNHHSFMETITNTILTDLWMAMRPYWCRVQGLFAPRGATRINVYSERFKKLPNSKRLQIEKRVSDYRREMPLDTASCKV